jgi:hypothetical protein
VGELLTHSDFSSVAFGLRCKTAKRPGSSAMEFTSKRTTARLMHSIVNPLAVKHDMESRRTSIEYSMPSILEGRGKPTFPSKQRGIRLKHS